MDASDCLYEQKLWYIVKVVAINKVLVKNKVNGYVGESPYLAVYKYMGFGYLNTFTIL